MTEYFNTYFDLIPTDISNIIVSYLVNSDDLENFILSLNFLYSSFQGSFSKKNDLISLLNWSVVHFLHFGTFTIGVDYKEYLRLLQVEKLISVLKLGYTIEELFNLKILYLMGTRLTYIPKEIGTLTNLLRLYLDHNLIMNIPKEIGNLSNLQVLDLSSNQLTHLSLPKEIGNLSNLQKLYLNKNQLTEIPKEICNLNNLKELDLSKNQLKTIPKEIEQLRDLNNLIIYQ